MPDTTPSIGLFWAVTGPDGRICLLTYPCALADAEPFGECLTSPAGHYETCQGWRRGRPKPPLTLLTPDRFVVYADRQLLTPSWLAQVMAHFHLPPKRTTARSDLHYRSTRAIGPP